MRDRTRETLLEGMTADLAVLEARDRGQPPAATRAAIQLAEWSARGFPRGGERAGSRSGRFDPTLAAVITGPDPYQVMRAELDELIEAAARALQRAAVITMAARPVGEFDPEKEAPLEYCASCWRVKDHKRRPLLSPARSVPESVDDVPRRPLCRWCYEFTHSEGCWPPVALLEARRDGRRITQPMVAAVLSGRSA